MRQARDDSGMCSTVHRRLKMGGMIQALTMGSANLGADRVETARFVGFATLAFV